MHIQSFYSVVTCPDVAAARGFLESHFGFVPRFVSDWYVHLGHPSQAWVELALIAAGHETLPGESRQPSRGLLINMEVEDVDAEYRRLQSAGLSVRVPLRDEPFGQRHFVVEGPGGLLVDVVKPIAPSAAFAGHYAPEVLPC